MSPAHEAIIKDKSQEVSDSLSNPRSIQTWDSEILHWKNPIGDVWVEEPDIASMTTGTWPELRFDTFWHPNPNSDCHSGWYVMMATFKAANMD
jgi:hypothetical protein